MTDCAEILDVKEEIQCDQVIKIVTVDIESKDTNKNKFERTKSSSKKRKIYVDHQNQNVLSKNIKIQRLSQRTMKKTADKILKIQSVKSLCDDYGKLSYEYAPLNTGAFSPISKELDHIKTESELEILDSAIVIGDPACDSNQCTIETQKFIANPSISSTILNQTSHNDESSSDTEYLHNNDQKSQSNEDDIGNNYIVSNGLHFCIYCNMSFKLLKNIERHECLICKTCKKLFTTRRALNRHIQNVHTITGEIFECKECNKTFKAKDYLESHIKSHEKKYECENCGKKFGTVSRLNEHMVKYKNPERLVCHICKMKLASRSSLRFHMRIHDTERVKHLKCNNCDFSTDDKRTLVKHQKSHAKREEKYKMLTVQCEKCPAKLKNIQSLKNHMYYVHSNLVFQCKICGIVVKTERNLKRHHINIHTGGRS